MTTSERPTSDAMLPCPFERGTCDHDALLVVTTADPGGRRDVKLGYVSCEDCGAKGPVCFAEPTEIHSLAVYSWNDRASAPASPAIGVQAVPPTSERPTSDALAETQGPYEARLCKDTPTVDAAEQFARWLEQGPKLAKAAGCYVAIKVTGGKP